MMIGRQARIAVGATTLLLGLGGPSCADTPAERDAVDVRLEDAATEATEETGADVPPACLAPRTRCGDLCIDTGSDASHCGVCGYACAAGERCCSGSCSSDCSLSIAALSEVHGPLSGGTWVELTGTGFAGDARVSFGGSRAPALVLDAGTIRAQTSPHVAGVVDVRVEQGGAVAHRGAAFRYAAYGFEGPWETIRMATPRGAYPGISVLTDGRVLVAGGRTESDNTSLLTTAELYDPATHATAPTAGELGAARVFVAQVTLLTGKVLVLGTANVYTATPNAELFDPATSMFAPTTGQPPAPQNRAFATLLCDGRVLATSQTTTGALVYDPATDGFAAVPGAPNGVGYEPVRLLDGRVLLVGAGPSEPAYLFDPDTGAFTAAGPGPVADASSWIYRGTQRAYVLPDGRVLAIGGYGARTVSSFDPATPALGFATTPYALAEPLHYTTITIMGDGSVFVIGGATVATGDCGRGGWTLTAGVERIDPVAAAIAPFDALPDAAMDLGAVTLLDGSVIAGGGEVCGGLPTHPYLYYLEGVPPLI